LNFAGLSVLQFGQFANEAIVIGSAITTGPAILGGTAANASLSSQVPIRVVRVGSWTSTAVSGTPVSLIEAPSIASILSLGEFDVNLQLNLPGATSTGMTLGSARILGNLSGGGWTINGSAGTIVAHTADSSWKPDVANKLNTLLVQSGGFAGAVQANTLGSAIIVGDFTGTLSTMSANIVRVTGSITNAAINLSMNGAAGTALNALIAAGPIVSSVISSISGDIGTIVASRLVSSKVLVGNSVDTFTGLAPGELGSSTLRSLRLTSRAADAFADSVVSANTITSAVLSEVTTNNFGATEGLLATSMRSLSATIASTAILAGPAQLSDTGTFNAFLSSKGIASTGDFDVEIVK
jgi:hypothetical protein